MATWYDKTSLDALLNAIQNPSTRLILISTYTQGQDYATVTGNEVATANIDNTDFVDPVDEATPPNSRRMVFSCVSGIGSIGGGGGADNHIAIISGSVVLAVTKELSTQTVVDGNPVTFPGFYLQANQPTQA